jgi:tetratricopeptide (TPR) repeat protein
VLSALLLVAVPAAGASVQRAEQASVAEAKDWFDRATKHFSQQQYDQAHAAYSKAIELYPDFTQAYVGRANASAKLGRREQAIEDLDRALVLDRRNLTAYNNRGMLYLNAEKYDRAVADFSKAISFEQNNPTYHLNRASAYYRLKEYDKAVVDYRIAAAADPKNGAAFAGLGAAYYGAGDKARAIESLEKACHLGNETGCKSLKALKR